MRYIADLHVHSRYSRATSGDADLEHLYIFSQLKGITVVATGDFTHPAWFAELGEKLEPAEPGLFRLKNDIARACDPAVPKACRRPVRFVLSTEISNIYKKKDRTRKNHNLVLMPDLAAAARFNARLDAIGNIKSDGRPILGLDARDLLEIVLEVDPAAYLIPAHIWTPWFSLFGSKSGFDAIADCFEDLTPHVFAVETGLSSDPPMNWRVSDIDGLTLVSNSDAHSPSKLGREACCFDTDLTYADMREALETGDPARYLGTYEFYPEEGKYHLDGHRCCGVCLSPADTRRYGGNCPVCGKPLTLGVLYRVEELADRALGEKPARRHPFRSIVPVEEILAEILGSGPKSKKVAAAYHRVLETLGPEFEILYTLPEEEIKKSGVLLLDLAIGRVRGGQVQLTPGFDGQYGRVSVFTPREIENLKGETRLFADVTEAPPPNKKSPLPAAPGVKAMKPAYQQTLPGLADDDPAPLTAVGSELNARQQEAAEHAQGPLMIIAGPGSGKTHTITCRMARLITEKGVAPDNILAITFTNRAAADMARRISEMAGTAAAVPRVATFHAFCFSLLKEAAEKPPVILDDADQRQLVAEALRLLDNPDKKGRELPARLAGIISRAKQLLLTPDDDLTAVSGDLPPDLTAAVFRAYQGLLADYGLWDYDDLITGVVNRLEQDETFGLACRTRYPHVFVDEYQDINYAQYRLIRALVPPDGNLCVIGDPDQAIYGFRGSDVSFFKTFQRDYPGARTVYLDQNYRSTETILAAAYDVIRRQPDDGERVRVYSGIGGLPAVTVAGLASDRAEATFVGKTIEALVGGLGFFSVDFGKAGYEDPGQTYGFSDLAVLFRTRAQGDIFAEVLGSAGIPYLLVSKENMFAASGVAELISCLRLCNDGGSLIDFIRVLSAGGQRLTAPAAEALKGWNRKHGLSVGEMLQKIACFPVPGLGKTVQGRLAALAESLQKMRTEMRGMKTAEQLAYILATRTDISALVESRRPSRDACDDLIRMAAEGGLDPVAFLTTAVLSSDADAHLPRADRVRLMTIHAAKGLEFPVVFVAGCEDGYLPLKRSDDKATDVDEERRLLYVAMTRAREQLFFTYARQRRVFGKTDGRRISPFVEDIENNLKIAIDPGKSKNSRVGPVQLELF